MSSSVRSRGENRFYVSPALRRQQQKNEKMKNYGVKIERRVESDQCGSNCCFSGRVSADGHFTNLDRFLAYTTPTVNAQSLPKTSVRGWRGGVLEDPMYFVLEDLWESFREWSAYGAGVPLLLDGSETVIQYYVPYLSGIQLYVDPSRLSPRLRRPGEASDTESSRESSSDGSSYYGVDTGAVKPWSQQNAAETNIQGFNRLSLRNKPTKKGSSSDEFETPNPPGRLVFEYMEHASPFTREPLADKILVLASQFTELKTYRSCDLSPSSWMSVAWYPIYRIPMGPTLQNLDACFLTFHSLGPSSQSPHVDGSSAGVHCAEMPLKLPLPTFGLASYKFRVSFWNSNDVYESQKANSLLRAADNWLRLLQVNHPDYRFFVSHNTNWR